MESVKNMLKEFDNRSSLIRENARDINEEVKMLRHHISVYRGIIDSIISELNNFHLDFKIFEDDLNTQALQDVIQKSFLEVEFNNNF